MFNLIAPKTNTNAAAHLRGKRRINACIHARKSGHVIDPERHTDAVLMMQLTRKTPAHTKVTKVVDDLAEDIT